ncbi:MAG: porin, partial [Rickettsiales bacterium]|nr:porin [Rickettsiales bacterium]
MTTALVSSSLFASAALANPTVTVGGHIDFQAGITDQDSIHETGANSRDAKFQNDTEVHVTVEGTTEGGLEY